MRWQVNDGVHWHTGERGGTILDLRSSRWHWLNPTAAALWEVLVDAGGAVTAPSQPALLAGVPPERISADLAYLAAQLHDAGVIEALPADTPRLRPAPPPPPASVPYAEPVSGAAARAASPERGALPALWAAAAMLHMLSIHRVVRLARAVRNHTGRLRPADAPRASAAVDAVRRAAAFYPGRAACLETSLAAALLCWAHHVPVTWALGVRYDPHECHAWISVDGQPVGEPAERDRALYPVLTI